MHRSTFVLLVSLTLIQLFPAAAVASDENGAENQTVKERVTQLELQVQELEGLVQQLLSTPPQAFTFDLSFQPLPVPSDSPQRVEVASVLFDVRVRSHLRIQFLAVDFTPPNF